MPSRNSSQGSGRFLFERRNLHVVHSAGKWVVYRESESGAARIYATQEEAVMRARQIAKSEGVDQVIHGRDGRIRTRDSYSAK